jgi:molecular chaperone IbpA
MTRVQKYAIGNMADILDNVRPFTVGFTRMFESLADVNDSVVSNYPPYNIVKCDDENYIIEIACAGFRKDEFEIQLLPDNNKLIVQGVQDRREDKRDYFHKGIGSRNFTRSFLLEGDVKVTDCEFTDGMLNIFLKRIIPEDRKPKQINVK